MLKKLLVFIVFILSLLVSQIGYSADIVIKNFPVSTSANIADTGFIQALTSGSTATIEQNADGNYIKITNVTATGDSLVYNNSWSGNATDEFVVSAKVKPNNLTGNKRVGFRLRTAAHVKPFDIRGTELYSCGILVPGFTVEEKWYDIMMVIRKLPSPSIDLYVDGVLTAQTSISNIDDYKDTGIHLRFEASGVGSELLVGDTQIIKAEQVTFSVEQRYIDNKTDPVTILFNRPVFTANWEDIISVTDSQENLLQLDSAEALEDGNGFTVKLLLTFTDSLPNSGEDYTVTLTNVIGCFGQGFLSPTENNVFSVLPDDFAYKWGNISIYKGVGIGQTQISTLQSGIITVEATVANEGKKGKYITLIAELVRNGKTERQHFAVRRLDAFSETQISTGFYLEKSEGTYLRLRVVDNITQQLELIEKIEGDEIFE